MKKLILLSVFLLPIFLIAQEGAYLGVQALHMSDKKAKVLGFETSEGYYIARTIANTPAEKAEFKSFDYIYAVNGVLLEDGFDLGDALDEINPEEMTTFSFIRNGQNMEYSVAVAEKRHQTIFKRSQYEDPFLGVVQNHSKIPSKINGVSVNIVDCSTAEVAGLENDDIITKIDGRPMFDFSDIRYAIDNRSVGDPIQVTYYRSGKVYEIKQPIKSLAASEDCEESIPILDTATPLLTEKVVNVSMKNVTEEEAKVMKEEKGIDMPIVNNLSIEALQIFPNPTSGIFELKFELPQNGDTRIRLFDATAKLIYQKDLGRFIGNFSDQIDISNQTRGIYFLEIQQDGLSLSKRVILQ